MSKKNEDNVQVIESATPDDVRPGDHITWESARARNGVTITERREGTAYCRDDYGDWHTVGGGLVTGRMVSGVTLTIRRPIRKLPTDLDTVIVANDGHEYIAATANGETWYAREAVCSAEGLWLGAWRSAERRRAYVATYQIAPDTCKVDEK